MANISIGDLTPRNQYTATAGQTDFTYSFPIFEDADLKVYIGETLQTLTTDYTVSGAGTDSGGTVTLTTGATLNDIVTIYRDLPVERTTDFQTNGDLLAETLNDELDALTMMVQQIEFDLNNRCLRFGQFTTGIPLSEFTENATDRANKVLAFDSSGDPNITQELGTYQGTDATTTTANYVIRDIVKDSSNSNIYICLADSTAGTLLTNTSYWALIVDAEAAASSASAAASSATAAASSATAAASSASAAATSETNAGTSETNAATSETNASNSATAAASSASAASTSETNAATSESNASTSETNAATSATNAASSATSAASSATTATTKASEASTSASNASTSETNAATSATNAATSATSASTAQTAAETAQTAAETAQAAAEAAQEAIDGLYLGALSSNPTVDGNGDPVTTGDWYFNTTDSSTYIYNGSSWDTLSPDLVGDSTPQLGGNLDTNGNDVNFGDNDKAQFGAGNDLQIYHSGTQSYIKDVGTGSLNIQANDLYLTDAGGKTLFYGAPDGKAQLRYNNSIRLETTSTGIDVTGTVTADAATLSGTAPILNYSDTDNSITAQIGSGTSDFNIATTTSHNIDIRTNNTRRMVVESDGDISFYEDTGTTPKFFWDASAERLGIGTTSPGSALSVATNGSAWATSSSDGVGINYNSGNANISTYLDTSTLQIGAGVTHKNGLTVYGYHSGNRIEFDVSGSERMRIDSSGNLLVGTTDTSVYSATSGGGIYSVPNGSTTIARQSITATQPLLILNETGVDGTLQEFRRDGTIVGIIGAGSRMWARTADLVDNDGSFDLDKATNFTCTPTGNITLTFTNIPNGQSGTIVLVNTGGHTISAASTTKVMGADMLTTITTAGTYVLGYISDSSVVRVYNSGAQQ